MGLRGGDGSLGESETATGSESVFALSRAGLCANWGVGGAGGECGWSDVTGAGGLNVSESISRLTSLAAAAFKDDSSSMSALIRGTGTRLVFGESIGVEDVLGSGPVGVRTGWMRHEHK